MMSMKKLAVIAAVSLYSGINSKNQTGQIATTPATSYISNSVPVSGTVTGVRSTASAGSGVSSVGGGGIGSVVGSSGSSISELVKSNSPNTSSDSGGFVLPFGVTTGGGTGGFYQGQQTMRPGTTLHGNVNVLLGGAMLSVVITVVCIVCYCCHRNIKKRSASIYRQRWLENDANMEIYSVEQCYETSGLFAETPDTVTSSIHLNASNHGGPPPPYDAVVAMDEIIGRVSPPPGYNVSDHSSNEMNRNAGATGGSIICGGSDIHKKTLSNQQQQTVGGVLVGCNRGLGKCAQHHHHHVNNSASCCSFERSTDDNDFDNSGQESDRQHNEENARQQQRQQPVTSVSSMCCRNIHNELNNVNYINTCNHNNNNNSNNNNNNHQSLHHQNHCHQQCSLCGNIQPCTSSTLSIDSGFDNTTATDVQNGNHVLSCTKCSSLPPTINLNCRPSPAPSTRDINSNSTECSVENDNNNNNNQENNAPVNLSHANNSIQQQSSPSCCDSANDLDMTFNENGIIRLDMSRIMDKTGLPTYEAALKLESSGYV